MLLKRLSLLAFLAAAPFAHAQFGAYADFTASRLYGLNPSSRPALNSNVNPTGGTFGAFYDFRTLGPARIGVDARFTHEGDRKGTSAQSLGAGTKLNSTLGGVKATFHIPVKLLIPYVQASAGVARFSIDSTTTSSSFEYHVYGGMDYMLLPHVGWRVFEAGFGGISSSKTGSSNLPLASISTGVVFRFGGN